ncbi:MAG TPA: hypothetical protein V6C91_23550 [Coleofasciculaceae cyanobacterium]
MNKVSDSEVFGSVTDLMEPQAVMASPEWEATDFDSNLLVIRPSSVCLNLEDLKCFEAVDSQFQHYGIAFTNAIALQPSNPAYPPRTSSTVLMGAPKSGWMEIAFSQPICQFCCYVTSSQRMLMSAYNRQGNLLVRHSLPEANLDGSDSSISPNTEFKIEVPDISQITFYAFDGQLTLADLSFSF